MRRVAVFVLVLVVVGVTATVSRVAHGSKEAANAPEVSPLAVYLGFGYHPEKEDAIAAQAENSQEAFIEGCMRSAGFLYIPEHPLEEKDGVLSEDDGAARQNDSYRDKLSDAELSSYQVTMYGYVPDPGGQVGGSAKFDTDGDGRIALQERSAMGCRGAATAKYPGTGAVRSALASELREMEDAISSSQDVAEGREAWAKCMNALGYEGKTASEVQQSQLKAAADGRLTRDNYAMLEPCNDFVRAGYATARIREEQAFFENNKAAIEELALRP